MKRISLLTIGNSFSGNAVRYLGDIATGTGVDFFIGRADLGGCSLEKHWHLAEYCREHPELKPYRLMSEGGERAVNLYEILSATAWDYVTLQQVSSDSWRESSFQPYLGELAALAGKLAPGAEALLHQTWAYRSDSHLMMEFGINQLTMHREIAAAYRKFSEELGLRVIPSGDAVQRVRDTEGHKYLWPDPDFDYADPVAPALPNQANSLITGWHWNIINTLDGRPRLQNDYRHLNEAGCFLVGCVWFEFISGIDCRKSSFVPAGIRDEDAAFFREIAHQVQAG